MSDPEKTTIISAEDSAKQLDALYSEIVRQRSVNRRASIIGLLCVLIVLLVLCLKLYGIFNEYQKYAKDIDNNELMAALKDPSYSGSISKHSNPEIEKAFKSVIKEGHDRLVPAVRETQDVLVKKILPDFSERVTQALADKQDLFQKAGVRLQDNLTKHVEKMVKEDMLDILGTELAKMSEDLRTQFPELTDEKLQKELVESEAYFYDELHELGLRKIAKFDPVLRSLSVRIDSLAKDQKITPEMREQIANDFFEALFDRMKYEFVPSLGEQMVEPTVEKAEGGADAKAGTKEVPAKSVEPTKKGGDK